MRRFFHNLLGALVMVGVCSIAVLASATAAEVDFEAANAAYEQGRYSEAAQLYSKFDQSGLVSPALLFNLGNAWFKAGETGRALAAYRRAQSLKPRDPDLRANLKFARETVQGPAWKPSFSHRWFRFLTLNEWTGLAAGALWLFLGLLSARLWKPKLSPALRLPTLAASGFLGLSSVCLAVAMHQNAQPYAIVVSDRAGARLGPLEESPEAFVVMDGAEFPVLDRKDQWVQVSPDGKRYGWLSAKDVLIQ